jgi:predicted ATPase
MEGGHADQGLRALGSIQEMEREAVMGAEIRRLEGELMLRGARARRDEAKRCFDEAIAFARARSVKSFELRAATSLARLLAEQGHRDDARAALADVYGWFTEGFDTADLKAAKALLEAL